MINRPLRPAIRRGSIREFFAGDPNLKGCWSLNGHARDESGNGNHGTLNGGMGYKGGKFGLAGSFDGTDDCIDCSGASYSTLSTFTLIGWVNTTYSAGSQRILTLTDYNTAEADMPPQFFIRTSGGYAQVFARGLNENISKNSAKVISDDKTHLVIGIINGSTGTVYLFLDGLYEGSATNGAAFATDTMPHNYIGKYANIESGSSQFWHNLIFETGILSRALSPAEQAQYYRDAILEPRKYWFYSPAIGGVIVPWHLFPQNTLGQGVA